MARASSGFIFDKRPFAILEDSDSCASTSVSSRDRASTGESAYSSSTVEFILEPSISRSRSSTDPRALRETCHNTHHSSPGVLRGHIPSESIRPVDLEEVYSVNFSDSSGTLRVEATPPRRFKTRPPIEVDTFEPLTVEDDDRDTLESSDVRSSPAFHQLEPIAEEPSLSSLNPASNSISLDHPLDHIADVLPGLEEQIARHEAGQYDLRLSYPPKVDLVAGGGGDSQRTSIRQIVYGCNFVRSEDIPSNDNPSGSQGTGNIFVIATPLGNEALNHDKSKLLADQMSQFGLEPPLASSQPHTPQRPGNSGARPSLTPRDDSNFSVHSARSAPSPAPRSTQIEDSVEALDKLQEELEAVNAVAQFGRVFSPETTVNSQNVESPRPRQKYGISRTTSTVRRTAPRGQAATVRVRPSEARPSLGRPRSSSVGPSDQEAKEPASHTQASARKLVHRPASLAPPKPLAKSTKQPTVSTFSLPGEAVARRLKEQREARLSLQISPETAARVIPAATLPQRAKSTKVPTRPNFELPGEAISRRKREAYEARIKTEQEEERKRREFKARPIRASIVPNALPRETIASRARQNKTAAEASVAKTAAPAMASKRLSVAGSSLGGSPHNRGRPSAISSSQVSRATSASTGSVSGKRSTLSAEDSYNQKLRGKEIYQQDNSMTGDRERLRREREDKARRAREEAAERSRQASREWAEKQKRKVSTQLQARSQAEAAFAGSC